MALQCDSACEDADEASGQWEVYGGPTGPFRMDSRVCKAALVAGIPVGRYAEADEIAATVAWLLSDEVPYMHGEVVTVGGGLYP